MTRALRPLLVEKLVPLREIPEESLDMTKKKPAQLMHCGANCGLLKAARLGV